MDIQEQIDQLSKQLDNLRSRQLQMTNEMIGLEKQLAKLKITVSPLNSVEVNTEHALSSVKKDKPTNLLHSVNEHLPAKRSAGFRSYFHITAELEDFIGTNLISKIGILITIIGVFIGAKYAIDKDLISPLMRIILSYFFAGILFFIALRLKPRYENFSSILMGGGLAVTYFITYIAFSFYHLFPQGVAFVMMVVTTGAAVSIALWYNKKMIALIGQVGAYAIPFLLGDGRGNAVVLFSYISIINIGLLVLSFRKDWKILYHIAFFLTWVVYTFWIVNADKTSSAFSTTLLFLAINFFTFYATFLSYKVFKKPMYQGGEIAILLLNALLFFFLGGVLINEYFGFNSVLTWFTLSNAIIHFVVGYCIYTLKLADNTVFQFILGLGLLFVTGAMPVEFDGNWVTLLWAIEATTLFYIASTNMRGLYLDIAFPLAIIALLSLLQDWGIAYSHPVNLSPGKTFVQAFSNFNFWSSLFVCLCFGYMSYHSGKGVISNLSVNAKSFFNKALPVIFIFILYFTFFNELSLAWDILIQQNNLNGIKENYQHLQTATLIIFSCLYIAILMGVNARWIKSRNIYILLLIAAAIANVTMLFKGLYVLGELRDNYLQRPFVTAPSTWLITIRYCCFMALAILWISASRALKSGEPSTTLQVFFSLLFNFSLLGILCNEFVHWMDVAGYSNQYKLGLSIICGVYALSLIFAGIIKKKKHLRIGAMFLFGLTLLKLFVYDLSSLSTISKTVVLLMLGMLLLVISFLYNKYKDLLFAKKE